MRHCGRACGWALRPLGQLSVLSIYSAGVWALRTGPGLCLQPPPQGEELIPRPGLSRSCARPPGPRGLGSCGECGRLGVAAHCLEQTRCPLPVTDFLPGPQEPEKGHFWHHSKCRQLAGCRPLTGVSPVAAWGQFDFSQSPFSPPPTAPLDNDEGHSDLEIDLHFDQRGSHRRRLRGPAAWAKAPVNGGL